MEEIEKWQDKALKTIKPFPNNRYRKLLEEVPHFVVEKKLGEVE